jgi:hypothetical protein
VWLCWPSLQAAIDDGDNEQTNKIMDSNNNNNDDDTLVKVAIVGTGVAVGGGIAAVCCAPVLMLAGIGVLVIATLAGDGDSG